MKSTDLFDSMNDIPDELIQAAEVSPEAMAAGGYGVTSGEKRRDFFARVTSSGWFVAAVSLIVAFGVVALILRAGRANPGIVNPPVGGTSAQEGMQSTQPLSDSAENGDFSFAYRLTSGTYSPGDTVSFTASLTHRGDAYTFSGSPDELAPDAKLVCRSYELNVDHLIREIWTEMTVKNGDTFSSNYSVILPEDCPEGSYDLILSYGDTAVTFLGILHVEHEGEQEHESEQETDAFVFSYDMDQTTHKTRDNFSVTVSMTNQGQDFTLDGDWKDYIPVVVLSLGGAYEIQASVVTEQTEPPRLSEEEDSHVLPHGYVFESKQRFIIPQNAPSGRYDLIISCGTATATFTAAVEVINEEENTQVPTVSDPVFSANGQDVVADRQLAWKKYIAVDGWVNADWFLNSSQWQKMQLPTLYLRTGENIVTLNIPSNILVSDDLKLYNADRDQIASGTIAQDGSRRFTFQIPEAGIYYLCIWFSETGQYMVDSHGYGDYERSGGDLVVRLVVSRP